MAKVKLPIYQRTNLIGGDFGTGDPYWDNVVMLMLFTEPNNFGVTNDISTNSFIGTFQNNATIDTTVSRFPGSRFGPSYSATFDGTSDYISIPDDTSLSPVAESFTVECHIMFNGDPTTSQQTFVGKWNNGFPAGSQKEWWVGYRNNSIQAFHSSSGSNGLFSLNESWNPEGDVWYHIAFVMDRSIATHASRVFVDGVQLGSDDTSINATPTIPNSLSEVWIGGYNDDANDWFNGWVDNVRITKGVARYTKNFTPPKAPYPNYKKRGPSTSIYPAPPFDPFFNNVELLLNMDGTDGGTTFTDFSNNSYTMSSSGANNSDTQVKFGTTSGEITGALGNSITTTNVIIDETQSWTIECWVWLIDPGYGGGSRPDPLHPIAYQYSGGGNSDQGIYIASTGQLSFYRGSGHTNATANYAWSSFLPGSPQVGVQFGEWTHVAVSYDVGSPRTMYAFINGTKLDVPAVIDGGWFDSGTPWRIGDWSHPSYSAFRSTMNGYIDDYRVSSVCRYTADFTPPTQAFPTSA